MLTQNDIAEVAALVHAAVERAEEHGLDADVFLPLGEALGQLHTTPKTLTHELVRFDDNIDVVDPDTCTRYFERYPDTTPAQLKRVFEHIRRVSDATIFVQALSDYDDPFSFSLQITFGYVAYTPRRYKEWEAIEWDMLDDETPPNLIVSPIWKQED